MQHEMKFLDPTLVPVDRIPALMAQLAALQTALAARLIATPGNTETELQTGEREELLTPDEAADLLSVSVKWMYRHAGGLPFTRRLSRKALRFSKAGLLKWQAGRRA
jgi:hypothetical protein